MISVNIFDARLLACIVFVALSFGMQDNIMES